MMLLYGYDGGTLYSVLNTLTIGFLKNENVNNVMACLEYVFEKFGGVELNNPEILKATKTIVQTGAELLQTDKDYEPIVCELLNEIERRMCPNEDGTDEYIQKLLDDGVH